MGRLPTTRSRATVSAGIVQQAERGQDVLDLLALVEADTADDLVGDAAEAERLLNGPALRRRAVHDGDVVVGDAVQTRPCAGSRRR